jgi:V/A-type H+-transporting ATPase subunit A
VQSRLSRVLSQEAELQEVVQLVGPDALQDSDRLVLEVSRMIRDGFLQQNAMSATDATCPLAKQLGMIELLLRFFDLASGALENDVYFDKILEIPEREELLRLRDIETEVFDSEREALDKRLESRFSDLIQEAGRT